MHFHPEQTSDKKLWRVKNALNHRTIPILPDHHQALLFGEQFRIFDGLAIRNLVFQEDSILLFLIDVQSNYFENAFSCDNCNKITKEASPL